MLQPESQEGDTPSVLLAAAGGKQVRWAIAWDRHGASPIARQGARMRAERVPRCGAGRACRLTRDSNEPDTSWRRFVALLAGEEVQHGAAE